MSEERATDAQWEQRAALGAAIQAGLDDIDAGHYEVVDEPATWVHGVAQTVPTRSIA